MKKEFYISAKFPEEAFDIAMEQVESIVSLFKKTHGSEEYFPKPKMKKRKPCK